MIESLQVLILGVCVYISPRLFLSCGSWWFPELKDTGGWLDRAQTLRRNVWKAFFLVAGLVVVVVGTQFWHGRVCRLSSRDVWRLAAIVLALTATLGRGGWGIQSYKGNTIIERIDRGMYVLSQLGATTILLLLLLGEE
jgi:hypothetical protein